MIDHIEKLFRVWARQESNQAVARMGGPGSPPAVARPYVSLKARMLGEQAQTVVRRRGVSR
ncbi:MAG: hypothetical protein P8Y54_02145 [Xanthomonadales bacterium]